MSDKLDQAILRALAPGRDGSGPPRPAAPFAGKVGPDAYVWHLVLRNAAGPLRPERLASLVLSPDDVARFGLPAIERALGSSRQQWVAIAARAGYVEGYTVDVVHERGFVRSLFPGAVAAGAPAGGL
jgi:hypothetical protein